MRRTRQFKVGAGLHPAVPELKGGHPGIGRESPPERTLPVSAVIGRMAGRQYSEILANLDGALASEDAEALHELRIAVRHLRVILRAFRKPLAPTSASRVEGDLQRLNRALGSARDGDVWLCFLDSEPVASKLADHRLWRRFVAHQREIRRLQQATVRRHLRGARFAALRTRIERLLQKEIPQLPVKRRLEEFARRAVSRSLDRAIKLGRWRRARSLKKLHRLRISLRRIRYLVDGFEEVLGPEVRRLRRRAHRVERILGEVRDTRLALERIADQGPAPPRPLVSHLQNARNAEQASLDDSWRRLADPKFLKKIREEIEGPAPSEVEGSGPGQL